MRKRRLREDFLEAELSDALRGTACPVCALVHETERAVASWLATTNLREDATISRLVDGQGLCASHWSDLLERRDGDLGVSGAGVVARIAEAAAADVGPGMAVVSCLVCASVDRRERSVIEMLLELLSDPQEGPVHPVGAPLCRPHLAATVEVAPVGVSRTLAAAHRRALLALAERARTEASAAQRQRIVHRIVELFVGS